VQCSREELAGGDVELTGHEEHAALASSGLYVSDGHAAHSVGAGWYPGLHTQSDSAVAPGAGVPALTGHGRQALSAAARNESIGHCVHPLLYAPSKPGRQVQSDAKSEPVTAVEAFAVHARHELLPLKFL